MDNKNIKKFYQLAPRPFNYVPNDLVDSSPSIPPTMSGLMRINPATGDIWVSAGNTLVSDWKLITGGGGGTSLTLETNGTPNGEQTLLNLRDTGGSGAPGVILEDSGTGTVFVSLDLALIRAVNPLTVNTTIPLLGQTTYTNIPALGFNVLANHVYSFRFLINYALTGTGNGVAFSINGVANSFLNYYMLSNPTTTGPGAFIQTLYLTSYNSPPTGTYGSSFSATANFVIIEGIVSPTVGGAISATIISDGQAGNCFITAGSYVEYTGTPI